MNPKQMSANFDLAAQCKFYRLHSNISSEVHTFLQMRNYKFKKSDFLKAKVPLRRTDAFLNPPAYYAHERADRAQ